MLRHFSDIVTVTRSEGEGRDVHKRRYKRRPCEDGDRDWSYAATNAAVQGLQAATISWRGKEGILSRTFRGSMALLTP